MLIDPTIVERSIAKAARAHFDPEKLSAILGDGDRSRRTGVQQREQRYAQLLTETGEADYARTGLERLLGGNDLTPISYLERGTLASHSVCRIRLRDSSGTTVGFGTGFLVGPGAILTNHHVISGIEEARGAWAEFNYELDLHGEEKPTVTFSFRNDILPITLENLDFCLAAVETRSSDGKRFLDEFGWLSLNPSPGKAFFGEYLTIIQHPGGEPKQVCVRENKLLKYDEAGDTIWYNTDTVAGSSGSPVFNNSWQVVALHHSGVPRTDAKGRWLTVDGKVWDQSMDETQVDWIANEGIRISRILAYLSSAQATHPLAQAILRVSSPQILVSTPATNDREQIGSVTSESVDGELRVTIPIRIAVRVGDGGLSRPGGALPQAPSPIGTWGPGLALPTGVERVDVDQSNYDQRTGYLEDFLGTGSSIIPLPVLAKAGLKGQALTFTFKDKKTQELKYWD